VTGRHLKNLLVISSGTCGEENPQKPGNPGSPRDRVRSDPGKVWKVMEFKVEIFQALKNLEDDQRYGKVWKDPRNL